MTVSEMEESWWRKAIVILIPSETRCEVGRAYLNETVVYVCTLQVGTVPASAPNVTFFSVATSLLT